MRREAQEQEELLKEPEIEGYDLSDDEIGQIYPEEVNDIFPFENKSLFEGENPQTQKENPENNLYFHSFDIRLVQSILIF